MSLATSFSNLISSPTKHTTSTITTTANPLPQAPTEEGENQFSISHLPYELRQLIYTSYILTLPPIPITPTNASLPHHNFTPLSQSSPFFICDISPSTFHHYSTIVFSSGTAMKTFSASYSRRQEVRRIRIVEGKDDCPTRDWVFLMNECFEGLEEVTFELSGKRYCASFGSWWGCVRDAVREGLSCKNSEKGQGGHGRKGKGLRLRVEDGEWGVCEVLR